MMRGRRGSSWCVKVSGKVSREIWAASPADALKVCRQKVERDKAPT